MSTVQLNFCSPVSLMQVNVWLAGPEWQRVQSAAPEDTDPCRQVGRSQKNDLVSSKQWDGWSKGVH